MKRRPPAGAPLAIDHLTVEYTLRQWGEYLPARGREALRAASQELNELRIVVKQLRAERRLCTCYDPICRAARKPREKR